MYYIEPYHTSLSAHLHGVCYAQYGRSSPFLLFVYSALSFWLCCPSHTCCCGKCEKDDMKCPGKEYQSTNVLTCPLHALAYEIECNHCAVHGTYRDLSFADQKQLHCCHTL